jgi:predicted acyl esterase
MMTEVHYEMSVEKDVGITMCDGVVLRANVYRPAAEGRFPVVMAQGVYGKDAHFADAFKPQWDKLIEIYPDIERNGSTGRYLRWETVDPERWVPEGYVVIQIDSRGTGKSPGYLDPRSPREMQDYYECIEWAGTQSWSNGRVGLCGISYYAFTQWAVAAMQPPHLAAICPWEGFVDYYRDSTHQGGIFANTFTTAWWPRQVLVNQYGNAGTIHRDRETGERTTGGPALSDEILKGNRADYPGDLLAHSLDDAWYGERTPDLSRIKVPMLSAGNWGGPGLHLRGNIEGYLGASSAQKWLSLHVGTHYESFYLPEYVAMQKRFFDHFLKGLDNGWDKEPPVQISVRRPDGSARRMEQEFPPARTQWTRFYLDAANKSIAPGNSDKEASVSYQALGDGIDFSTAPFAEETEICGFITARLWVASSTTDMDIFAILRVFAPNGEEVTFVGAHETTNMTKGWLRVSHRKVDKKRALPYRVFHAHDEVQKLTPGEFYPVDVEIWPTSMVFPKGYRLVLTLMGKDFEFPGTPGRMLHDHPLDRSAEEFGGVNTIMTGGRYESFLLMPLIPAGNGA